MNFSFNYILVTNLNYFLFYNLIKIISHKLKIKEVSLHY